MARTEKKSAGENPRPRVQPGCPVWHTAWHALHGLNEEGADVKAVRVGVRLADLEVAVLLFVATLEL